MTISPLTVETAEITTATIEIKTLTVRDRQVTLALFRQLLTAPLVTEDGDLLGTPWGKVNYHPDKCSHDAEHLHVVWQTGPELRRATVWRRDHFPSDVVPISDGASAAWLCTASLAGWLPSELRPGTTETFSRNQLLNLATIQVHFESGAPTTRMRVPAVIRNFWLALDRAKSSWGNEEQRTKAAHDQLREAFDDWAIPDRSAANAGVAAEVDTHLARRPVLAQRWADLNALPQLFIAT